MAGSRASGFDDLAPDGDDRDRRAPGDRNVVQTEGCEQCDVPYVEHLSGANDDVSESDILADAADVRPAPDRLRKADRIPGSLHVLLHDDGRHSARHRRAGQDAHASAIGPAGRIAGTDMAFHRDELADRTQGLTPEAVAIDRGVVEWRQCHWRRDGGRRNAPSCAG